MTVLNTAPFDGMVSGQMCFDKFCIITTMFRLVFCDAGSMGSVISKLIVLSSDWDSVFRWGAHVCVPTAQDENVSFSVWFTFSFLTLGIDCAFDIAVSCCSGNWSSLRCYLAAEYGGIVNRLLVLRNTHVLCPRIIDPWWELAWSCLEIEGE